MAVGANDAVACRHQALLGQQRVLDAHFAHIKEIQNIVFVGKIAALLALLGAFDILVGHKVIQHNVDLGAVKHRGEPGLVELVDGHRGGDVVAQHYIQIGIDQLPGLHFRQARMGCQNFLRHCHSHDTFSLSFPDQWLFTAETSARVPAIMISV